MSEIRKKEIIVMINTGAINLKKYCVSFKSSMAVPFLNERNKSLTYTYLFINTIQQKI